MAYSFLVTTSNATRSFNMVNLTSFVVAVPEGVLRPLTHHDVRALTFATTQMAYKKLLVRIRFVKQWPTQQSFVLTRRAC